MANALTILAVAVIGKQGQPLFLRNFSSQQGGEADLKWHYVTHTSLDHFEERDALAARTVDTYFGLLYTMEDYAVYGYQTNSRIRFVLCLALSELLVKDIEVKSIFTNLHTAYINYLANPFVQVPADAQTFISPPIRSKRFAIAVDSIGGIATST